MFSGLSSKVFVPGFTKLELSSVVHPIHFIMYFKSNYLICLLETTLLIFCLTCVSLAVLSLIVAL